MITLLLFVRAICMYIYTYLIVRRANPVRGESQIQRNATGEGATISFLDSSARNYLKFALISPA